MDTIQSLWVDGSLSPVEQLSIKSYLKAGHPFNLYTYGDVKGVPTGALVKDAEEIAPKWKIAKFQNLANFSDYFRFMMLYKRGGYWSDLDVCCLHAYDFEGPYVFASQNSGPPEVEAREVLTSCVIKSPPGSNIMRRCLERISMTDTMHNGWADIGPILLIEEVPKCGLQQYAKSKLTFCPLDHYDAPDCIFGNGSGLLEFCSTDTRAVHMWNEEARRAGIDKYSSYPNSMFETLQRRIG